MVVRQFPILIGYCGYLYLDGNDVMMISTDSEQFVEQ